ncbi:MAG: VWA domain-containing protein [Terracidiphilus sp.]
MFFRATKQGGTAVALLFCAGVLLAQTAEPSGASAPAGLGDPVLLKRPAAKPDAPRPTITHEGKIHLDVLVADTAGKPAAGLEPWDFTVLDNGARRKILSFRSYDGVQTKPDPPVEAILLLDRVSLNFQQAATARAQVRQFLLAEDGKLPLPVSLMALTDAGLRAQPRPSTDGKALVKALDSIESNVHRYTSAMGGEGSVERMKVATRALMQIAESEAKKPGRKILLWIGPGWPQLSDQTLSYTAQTRRDQLNNFKTVVDITNWLREARITLYSLGGGDAFFFREELKPAATAEKLLNSSLATQVFAVHSGGRTVTSSNYTDIADWIGRCVAESQAFYTLSFDPPPGAKADEYHELKVDVDKPGRTARTTTGYYGGP